MPDLIELRDMLTNISNFRPADSELLKFVIVIMLHCYFLKIQESCTCEDRLNYQQDFDSLSNLYHQFNKSESFSRKKFENIFKLSRDKVLLYVDKLVEYAKEPIAG